MYNPITAWVLCPGWLKQRSELLENFVDWERDYLVPAFQDGFATAVKRAPTCNELAAMNSRLLLEVSGSYRASLERPFGAGYAAQSPDDIGSTKGQERLHRSLASAGFGRVCPKLPCCRFRGSLEVHPGGTELECGRGF